MASLLLGDSRRKYSWWWDSHISPKNSKWLQENLTDMDRNVKAMIKLIEEDADSFAKRAEMYYKKRPELMKIVEEFYRAYRALAERYDSATGALRQAHKTMAEAFPNQVPPMMSEDSPSSISDFYPSSPEMLSPIRGILDFDDSSSKKGLKQLREMFPFSEEKVKKALSFNEEEGFKSEIKRLQEEISQLSLKNENLMKEMSLESQRARALQDTVFELESGKQNAIFWYKNSIERVSVLETGIFNMSCELNEVNDQMIAKLNGVEEKFHSMESLGRSLQLKLEAQQKELDKKVLELEELNVVFETEREKRMQSEASLMSLEQIHTHSQEETERLCLEVQYCTEKLKDMEANKAALEERINEHDTIMSNLRGQNLSYDARIQEMLNEMQLLKVTKEKLEYELNLTTENNKALQEEVNCLENSLSSANIEIEGLKVSSHALEVFCETIVSEISTHSVEKGVWISHMESISDQMESLEVKNSLLENSLSDTNTELENLRARFKDMEESCMSFCDQNSSLLMEKNNLVFQVENLDSKYLKLENKYSDLEKERDYKTQELLDLQSSSRLKKQEHDAAVWSMSNQLEFLSTQISHLKVDFEMEQHKFMNSSLERFILQNCLRDMKDEHLLLFGEYQSALEASKCAENQLSRLSHAEVILKGDIILLMERNKELSEGFHLLMDALKINVQNRNVNKGVVQFILDEIRNILNSIAKLRDENGKLHLKVANHDNQYLELMDKHSNLMREKDAMSHQFIELQNSSTQEKEYHANLVSKLKEEINRSTENIDMERQNVMDYHFENFVLQRCLYDMKDTNLFLLREQCDILEEYKRAHNQIVKLKDKDLFQISEMEALSASNAVLYRGMHLLQEELNIDVNDMNTKGTSNEMTLQNIFWEVKNMKSAVSLFQDENKQLHLKVEDLENQHLELVDEHSNLMREKDAMSHQLIELQNLLVQEKEHYDDVVSKLNEEINHSTESIEVERQNVMSSLFEIFVLQRCLCDMNDTNLSLLGEKLNILEEYKSAKNQIVELENKGNLQISEIETLSAGNAVLYKGVHMLLEELNIDVDGMNTKGSSNERILQNICGEIKNLKNSVSNFQDENKQLHLEVVKLDNQYLELLDRNSTLTREKDSMSHRLIELQHSFIEEKEHYENLVSKLNEEVNCSAVNIKMEQQKAVKSQFEVFVLQRSLCDMKDASLSLLGELNDILEEYRRTKDEIAELMNKELLQISKIETLSTGNAVLRKGIHLLLEELNIDLNGTNTKGTGDEMTLHNIFGEIKNLKNSVSNFQGENKQLHFKVENLDSRFLELLDKHSNLRRERDAISHQLLDLQTSLIQQKEQHEILVSTLNEEINHSMENIEMEQQKVMHSLFENFVLQRYLCDMKDTNLCLSAEQHDILEASKRAEVLITELKNKELFQASEIETLSMYNLVLQKGIHSLLEELNADAKNINIEGAANEMTLQNILWEVKNLKVSVSEFRDENKQLLLKINNLERNLLDLREKQKKLKKENHILQNHVRLLRKEYQDIDGDYEKEQERITNADIKNLVLQECIYDMGVKNIFLSDKCDHNDLIHKKELTLLFEALKIDTQNVTMTGPINKVTLQTILHRIESLENYISDVFDENQCLSTEKIVFETILNQVSLDKLHLFNELEFRTLELYSSEGRRKELIEMNEELKVVNDNFLSQIEVLRESMKILETKCLELEDKRSVLIIESEELESYFKSVEDERCVFKIENEELESSLKSIVNEHHALILSSKNQLAYLETQLYQLQKQMIDKEEELCNESERLHLEVKSIGHDFGILNRQYSELVEKIMNLEKENEDLVKSLKLEMQGHNDLMSSSKSHVSSLENQVDLVQKERMSLEDELLTEQEKTMSALLDNFVLQRCLLDTNDTNLTLSSDYQNLLEAFRCSEKFFSELKNEHKLYTQNQKNDAEKMNQKLNTEIELLNKELRELHNSYKNLVTEACKLCEAKHFSSVKLEALETENSTILAEAMKLEQLYIFFKSLSIERGFKLKLASNLAKILNEKFETQKNMLTQKEMEISEFQKERKILYENLVTSNLVKKELESKIRRLSSCLSSKDEHMIKCEGEIRTLLSDCYTSVLTASVFEGKVYELVEECERLDFLSVLHKEKLSEHIALNNVLEKKLESLGRENGDLKAELKSSYNAIACNEECMISPAKFSGMQDDRQMASAAEGIYEPHKLIIKVKLLQKAIEDTQHLLELERLDSKAKIESLMKEIEELKLKKSPLQELSKEKYVQTIKDIQLDQASSSYKASNNEPDDQMLELWEENTEADDIVEEIKSEYPSCELRVHDNESPRAWTKICNEKLDSDLKKLLMIQKGLQDLRIKLENLEKKKHLKSVEYSTLKEHIKDAEVAILEQIDIYGTLKHKVEQNFESSNAVIWEKERRSISEKARKVSLKIGKLESELQKIEYLVLKVQEEEENKRKLYLERKSTSTLLSEFIYNEDEVKGKKKGRFCGCMRPKTKS